MCFFSIFCFINKVSTDYTNPRSPKVGNKLVCGIGPRKTIYHSFTYLLVQQDLFIVSFFTIQTDTVVNKTSQARVCPFLEPNYYQFSSVAQSCPTLCNPMNSSMPGLPLHHRSSLKLNVRVSDAIQPSHPLSSPFPPAPNPSQHQSRFQSVNSVGRGKN